MVYILKKILKKIFHRKKKKSNSIKKFALPSQRVALPYCLFAILFFGGQGLVANLGAIDLVFPDLVYNPVAYQAGRAVHLNLSIMWPLLGIMGTVYYFFINEVKHELHSTLLAWIQFGIFMITAIAIFISLTFEYIRGPEFKEATKFLNIGIAITLGIFTYNLLLTYFKRSTPHGRVTLLTMLIGSITLLALYLPNILSYLHPTIEAVIRFWVVHMWEELSKQILVAAIMVALLLDLNPKNRKALEKLLLIHVGLIIISAAFATGHHYYWIGTPYFWLWIGGIFSVIQVLAIFLLGYIFYLSVRSLNWSEINVGTKLALAFILSSVFYHIIGAALMGMTLALPQFNFYLHGTFLTSAHAHLALFGAIGMLVLGSSTYIITKGANFTKLEYFSGWIGLIFINIGLLTMGFALSIAGLLQTYLWRLVGMEFMETYLLLNPYLIIRILGGMLFTLGSLLFLLSTVSFVIRKRKYLLDANK